MEEPRHFRRIMILWVALSVVATPLVVLLLAPSLPPGDETTQASGQVVDNTVLLAIVTPIVALILVYFAYALIVFRNRGPEADDAPAIQGDSRVQTTWIVSTTVIVLFLASYGTVRLFGDGGAGGGQGSDPIAKPSGSSLQVQVIAQQWAFTYRYPSYGGVETSHLELPVDQNVEFHVTSLDVIHSFWAHDLGVKADANPGVDNVAYAHPTETGNFDLRCAELCGLWHGHMFDTGSVVSQTDFQAWIQAQQREQAPATHNLTPYKLHYNPAPHRRAG